MKTRRPFLLALALLALATRSSQAQTSQTAPVVSAPPDILLLVHQEFQFGKEAERQKLDAAISRACDKISVPNMWIDLQSVTGTPKALAFDPFESFARIDEAFLAWPQIYASHPELATKQAQIRELLTSERTIIAVRRSDLSYNAAIIDLSKARFMRVLEVRLRPGHEDDFVEAFRILRAAYAKIHADTPWVVYQVNVGMPTPTFLAFVPMRELKQNDDLLSWRPALQDAEGAGAERMQQIARDAYLSTESNLYAISPETSHVSKEFAAGDPAFWLSRPQASAAPTADGPALDKTKQRTPSSETRQ